MPVTEVNWSSGDRTIGAQRRAPTWHLALAFVCGFLIQFDVLIGGNGEGAITTGGFGYRATDLLCVVLLALLGFHALVPRRLVPLSIYAALIGAMALLRVLDTTFGNDSRTVILALHYLGYSFAGLYVASLLGQEAAREKFCWGLILGLLTTIPIFVLQDQGLSSELAKFGLVPGYYQVLQLDIGDIQRYAGLWGHPNEAAHVADLAAPGAAYLFLVRRRLLPILLTGAALLAVFYYTQSRGGLLVGGAVLGAPFLFDRSGRINVIRLVLICAAVLAGIGFVSELRFVSSRFDDPGTAHNISERLNTIWAGLEILLTHPFGLSTDDFMSLIATDTGGVDSPHNGFILFGAIFGWLPLAVLIGALGRSFFIRSNGDALFAFVSLGLVLSFMFEQLPDAYPFALVMCTVVGWAFINTRVGRDLVATAFPRRQGVSLRYRRTSHAAISLLGPRE
jgi:O-Antigen ligase